FAYRNTSLLVCLSIVYFSDSCYRFYPPPNLPSFPTRRSSDLGLRCDFGSQRHLGKIDLEKRAALGMLSVEPGVRENEHAESGSLDRKSTRLNSSHVSISYAVFCLKKKIYI